MTSTSNKKSSSRTYGGLSESERVDERRERFLEAGLEVFGTVGLRGATVRVLCKAAGLTERYFYESFTDTEALFCAVYERENNRWREVFMEKVPHMPQDLEGRSRASLDVYFTAMRNERLVRVLHIESMAGSERVTSLHHYHTRISTEMSAMLIRLDYPDLTVTDEFLHALAMAINGASAAMAVQWMLGDYGIPQDILVEVCSVIVRGAIQELRSRSAPLR